MNIQNICFNRPLTFSGIIRVTVKPDQKLDTFEVPRHKMNGLSRDQKFHFFFFDPTIPKRCY